GMANGAGGNADAPATGGMSGGDPGGSTGGDAGDAGDGGTGAGGDAGTGASGGMAPMPPVPCSQSCVPRAPDPWQGPMAFGEAQAPNMLPNCPLGFNDPMPANLHRELI